MADIRTSASKAAWLPCYIMSCRTGPKCPLSGHQRWREKCVRLQRHRVTSSVKLSPFSVQRSRFRPLFAHIASPPVPISKLSVSTVRLSTRYSSKLAIIRCEAIPPRLRSGSTTGSVFDGRGGYADGAKSARLRKTRFRIAFNSGCGNDYRRGKCYATSGASYRIATLCIGRFEGPITFPGKCNWLSGRS